MRLRTRLLEDHKADCRAVANTENDVWSTPWAFLKLVQHRDRLGRMSRPGTMGDRWWYVPCNDPRCPGAITINETDLLVAASRREE